MILLLPINFVLLTTVVSSLWTIVLANPFMHPFIPRGLTWRVPDLFITPSTGLVTTVFLHSCRTLIQSLLLLLFFKMHLVNCQQRRSPSWFFRVCCTCLRSCFGPLDVCLYSTQIRYSSSPELHYSNLRILGCWNDRDLGYYDFTNRHGDTAGSKVYLVILSVFNSFRNAFTFSCCLLCALVMVL